MWEGRYLLDIGELLQTQNQEALVRSCRACLDTHRKQKIEKTRSQKVPAQGIGAGLLLQKAVRDYHKGALPLERGVWSVRALLEELQQEPCLEIRYRYGRRGKPYLEDVPMYFSLSHSHEMVLLAVSGEEIGADLQWSKETPSEKIAERFFAPREKQALLEAPKIRRQELFYRYWTRKEAYGKLTGEGVVSALQTDMTSPDGETFCMEEERIGQYFICICKKGTGGEQEERHGNLL